MLKRLLGLMVGATGLAVVPLVGAKEDVSLEIGLGRGVHARILEGCERPPANSA
jgi:hypothetical protein